MKSKIFFFLSLILMGGPLFGQTQPESADAIMKKAYAQAAKENKNVMVMFHASWCGWCKKLDASINDPSCSDYFNKNFVIVHLTVLENDANKSLENPGANEMYTKFSGGKAGIPFFLIFDKKEKLLADSYIRPAGTGLDKPGTNMGCPASPEEVAAFVEVLKNHTRITEAEIRAITERFSRNRG